ncbi:hypothetical protein C7972_11675 [Arenibacter sp. ARW7G5Y1]|nr:hypothetical protein C7972_11675 [Arenibacter sp. ARW7G5Y1]
MRLFFYVILMLEILYPKDGIARANQIFRAGTMEKAFTKSFINNRNHYEFFKFSIKGICRG